MAVVGGPLPPFHLSLWHGLTPALGMSLLYWQGSFRQRTDASGWQHEYWVETDAERLPEATRAAILERNPILPESDGTRQYLDLPLAWHHRHATGTLLSNANSDVEATWFPIAPMPFAVGTVVMLVAAIGSLFATDWVLALVGLAIFPALFALNVVYSRRMAPRQARAQQLRAEVSAIAHESGCPPNVIPCVSMLCGSEKNGSIAGS